MANHLEKNGVVENRYIFRAYTWLNNRDIQIKAGEYTLVDVEDIPDLVEKVKSGKVIDYSITLIEGKNFKEYLTQLRSQKQLVDELDSMSHDEIMTRLGAKGVHPEGQFAPQTYFYQKGASDFDVLKQAYDQAQNAKDADQETSNKGGKARFKRIAHRYKDVVENENEVSSAKL